MFRNLRRSLLVCVVLLGLAGAWVAYLNQQWFDPVRDLVWIWQNRHVPRVTPTRWRGQVTEVLDGKTCYFKGANGSIFRVTLFGLQSVGGPETLKTRAYRREQEQHALRDLVLLKDVEADFVTVPVNRHVEAILYLGSTNVNGALLASGDARVDRSKISSLPWRETYGWLAAERKARRLHRKE